MGPLAQTPQLTGFVLTQTDTTGPAQDDHPRATIARLFLSCIPKPRQRHSGTIPHQQRDPAEVRVLSGSRQDSPLAKVLRRTPASIWIFPLGLLEPQTLPTTLADDPGKEQSGTERRSRLGVATSAPGVSLPRLSLVAACDAG